MLPRPLGVYLSAMNAFALVLAASAAVAQESIRLIPGQLTLTGPSARQSVEEGLAATVREWNP